MKTIISIVLCLIIVASSQVAASPTGAPTDACETMTPGHGELPSTAPCPFETLLDQTTIFSNGSLTVTIQSKSTTNFKGFLVMGFNQITDQVVGTFQITDSLLSQTLGCYGSNNTAATHTSNDLKSIVKIKWLPPLGFNGDVVFKTTYVEVFTTYWVKQVSNTVKIVS